MTTSKKKNKNKERKKGKKILKEARRCPLKLSLGGAIHSQSYELFLAVSVVAGQYELCHLF